VLWTTNRIPHTFHVVRGTLAFKVADLHKKYGAVVRIGPNELSYIQDDAWKEIYAHRPEFVKDKGTFSPPPGAVYGILLTPSTKDHTRMRRNLNPAFSDKALRNQEPRIMKHVELLIERLHDHLKDGPVDLHAWYNFTTFDIIGDLYFGESFHCLESSQYNEW
jgi:cytochrome P450